MTDSIGNLPSEIITAIQNFIKEKKIEGLFGYNEIIREDIFSILENQSTVIYYPLENEENDGFHVYYPVKDKIQSFVYINTSKFIEKQIFTAAHELGHILKIESYLESNCTSYIKESDEFYVNRFAAELLIPEDLFRRIITEKNKDFEIQDNKISLYNFYRLVVYLMDFFFVPFKTILNRLYETHQIDEKTKKQILEQNNNKRNEDGSKMDSYSSVVQEFINEGKYLKLQKANNKKEFADLVELLTKAEKGGVFSKSKIENIRKLFDIPVTSLKEKDSDVSLKEDQNGQ